MDTQLDPHQPDDGGFRMYDDPANRGSMSARDVTSLVTLFASMLATAKSEILSAMRENSEAATERWRVHEREHIEVQNQVTKIEQRLDLHIEQATKIWQDFHDDEVRFEARLGPVKNTLLFVTKNWKMILVVGFALLGALGFGFEIYENILTNIGR